ncbi:hypothetical protein BC826DRAFT_503517 [Russula brevipes]|nr:hypothetical protein BC826DRAFT_503517 [Russula brevipes]
MPAPLLPPRLEDKSALGSSSSSNNNNSSSGALTLPLPLTLTTTFGPRHLPMKTISPHPLHPPRCLPSSSSSSSPSPYNALLTEFPGRGSFSLAWLNRLEPVSTPGGPTPQGGSQVAAAPPKRPRIQRSSSRPSKKRKDGRADGKDDPVRVTLIFLAPPTRLKFLPHEKDSASVLPDGKAGEPGQTPEIRWAQAQRRTPLDRPESCSICNIAFARQDARNRHFRSQHQHRRDAPPDSEPEDQKVYKPKRPSAPIQACYPRHVSEQP